MDVLTRFLNYITLGSPSNSSSNTCPSTKEQLAVGAFLKEEMENIGFEEVRIENGYVYGCISATAGYENKPCIGFIAHMDTAPDFNGFDIKPQVIEHYDGNDVILKGSGDVLSCKDFPALKGFKGHTLITTDGTTLLGADDKAGIAIIMQSVAEILQEQIPHGKIAVAFTPDEEIGRGANLFNVAEFGAKYAYTVDGSLPGEIEYQNFNAASATVTIKGRSIHPGTAKGQMINSQRIAFEFDGMLPVFDKPEYTENFEGFIHLTQCVGAIEETSLHYIIRDHDGTKFEEKQQLLQHIANFLNQKYGGQFVKVQTEVSYRNMEEKILPEFHLVENARKGIEQAGLTPKTVAIRGGTDGARLSFMGLPCPNLGTGGMNFHGKYECITKENMQACVAIVKNIAKIYAQNEG